MNLCKTAAGSANFSSVLYAAVIIIYLLNFNIQSTPQGHLRQITEF